MKRMHPYHHLEAAEETVLPSVSGGKPSYVDEISAFASKQKKRAERKNAAPADNGPTPERLAKAGNAGDIAVPIKDQDTRALTRVTTVKSAFEAHKEGLTDEEVSALTQALKDFMLAEETSIKVTSGYGEGGGSVPGPRHGGVPDHCREAAARVALFRARFHPAFIQIFDALCREARMRLQDAGRHHGHWRDEATSKGFGMGLLKGVAWRFSEEYSVLRALGGRHQRTHVEVQTALQVKREQRARRESGR